MYAWNKLKRGFCMLFDQHIVVSYKSATISLLTGTDGRITIMFNDDPSNNNVRYDGLTFVHKLFRFYTSVSSQKSFLVKYMTIHEGSGVHNYRFVLDNGEKRLMNEIEKKGWCYVKHRL